MSFAADPFGAVVDLLGTRDNSWATSIADQLDAVRLGFYREFERGSRPLLPGLDLLVDGPAGSSPAL